MSSSIRILLADDHPVVLDGLAAILNSQIDFEIVATARNGREAVERARELQPDIILLDLEMPEVDGVEAIKQLRAEPMTARIIVFTMYDSDDRIVAAVRAGAQGYLLKGTPREEIFQAVRIVHSGESLLQPVVATRLMKHLQDDPLHLTKRELEVLSQLGKGLTNKDIAEALSISERTVKFHVSSILGKLNAENRTEAVSLALKRGLIEN